MELRQIIREKGHGHAGGRATIPHVNEIKWPAFLRRLPWVAAGGFLLLLGFAFGYAFARAQPGDQLAMYNLVIDARRLLDENYLGELPSNGVLQRGMIRGLLDAVGDPYTKYLTPVDHELESQSLEGEYGGIGALLTQDEDNYVLIPLEDGPASEAGIREGDALLQVDDLAVSLEIPQSEIMAAIRGEAGSDVSVRVGRAGSAEEILSFTVTRATIPLPSVTTYLHPAYPRVGILAVASFGDGTLEEVRTGVEELERRGADRLVLDLRGNPGGLIDSAIEVADIFLDDGIIMTEQFKDGERQFYRAEASRRDVQLPLVVIVDGGTASSAEVLAAALGQAGRATLVGQNTFGKGSVQAIFALEDGSSLHITTARWFTPNQSQLDGIGIEPDTIVPQGDGGGDPALEVAVEQVLQQETAP